MGGLKLVLVKMVVISLNGSGTIGCRGFYVINFEAVMTQQLICCIMDLMEMFYDFSVEG